MTTTTPLKSVFTYRLRPPAGLEKTLLKELRSLKIPSKPHKVSGRNIIEITGPQSMMWQLMFKSRIAEDIQLRMSQPFLARGDKELKTNLQKLPWHCYLPKEDSEHKFKMPQTRAKCYESKLYHTQLVRDILIEQMTEQQIQKDFKLQQRLQGINSYKTFKKQWLAKKQTQEKDEIELLSKQQSPQQEEEGSEEGTGRQRKKIKTLDEVRTELKVKRDYVRNLKEMSKVTLSIVKDRAEVLISTSNEDLHKHGYKPFVRWGVLKETLTAACILESGVVHQATKTGKLYLWDPFCGSGSFLIESLMMLLDQPVRNFEEALPFEYWPIHQREEYEQFKEDLNDYQKMIKRNEIDIQIIGSDVSQKAIDTTTKNIEYAGIQGLCEHELLSTRSHRFINNPMIYSQHWPRPFSSQDSESSARSLINFKDPERPLFMSLYHGDFQDIGYKLADVTDNFKDFKILTNVPYGLQSKEKQRQTDTDLHNLYRRFGRFLRTYPNLEHNTYVVAQAHHYGHKLSFEKFSNCGWSKEIAFKNGGIGVHLLKYDMSQVSEVKQTLDAYKQIDALPTNDQKLDVVKGNKKEISE